MQNHLYGRKLKKTKDKGFYHAILTPKLKKLRKWKHVYSAVDKGDFTVTREFFFDTPFCASNFVMIWRHAVFVIVKYPMTK